MKTVKITTNGQPVPQDVQKIIDTITPLSIKEAKTVIANEVDFLVCDIDKYHGNYNGVCAWIGGKEPVSFTVNFEF